MNEIVITSADEFEYIVNEPLRGLVIRSKHDRVGVVAGHVSFSSSSSSSSYGYSYNGTGSHSSSYSSGSSFQFDISTTIDIRHEFWIRTDDGQECQIVLPFNVPLAEGQIVCISSVMVSVFGDTTPILLALQNESSRKVHMYHVGNGAFKEISSMAEAQVVMQTETPKLIDTLRGDSTFRAACTKLFEVDNPDAMTFKIEKPGPIPGARVLLVCAISITTGLFFGFTKGWGYGIAFGLMAHIIAGMGGAKFFPVAGHDTAANKQYSADKENFISALNLKITEFESGLLVTTTEHTMRILVAVLGVAA